MATTDTTAPDETAQTLIWLHEHEAQHLAELAEFIRIPSVSADPTRTDDMQRAAAWLAQACERAGLDNVRVHPAAGPPTVTAEWLAAGPGAPTAIVYGHYDVQPVDPLEEWVSDPWTLTERDGRIYARGATDDKGQLFMYLKAIQAILHTHGSLPVNLRLISDGEEEIGSPHLPAFLDANPWAVAGEVGLVSDSPMYGLNIPSVGYALRGLTALEFTVHTAANDLHSGQFGGAVPNAAHIAAAMITALHDDAGRVTVPGFYTGVDEVAAGERAAIAALPFDDAHWLGAVGVQRGTGEFGYSTLERTWIRPTLDVNGISSGYTGSGSKTIVPARATVKLSCRLVPNQDCSEVAEAITEHLRQLAPPSVKLTITRHHSGPPAIVPADHPAVRSAIRALGDSFGRPAVLVRDGGAIPAVAELARVSGAPCVLLGFGCPDENKHAPNEWLPLDHYRSGMHTLVRLLHLLGSHAQPPRQPPS